MSKIIYNLKEKKKEKWKKRFSFCPTVSTIGHIELQTHIQDRIRVYILTGPVITAIEQSSTQKKKKAHVFEMEKLHCESDQQVAFRQLTRENEKEKRPVDYQKKKKKDFD